MKTWRSGVSVVAALAACCLGVAGCSGGSEASGSGGEPTQGGSLAFGLNVDARSLDPAQCITSFQHCTPVFGTLMRYDIDEEEFVGQLAKSFESKDGKSWTLKLRDGVKFSDGTPLNAEAVVYNWDRIKDPKTLSPAIRLTDGVKWKAVDPLTVKVTLDEPNYQLPWALAHGGLGAIGSPTAIKKAGEDVGTEPVGAGPFILDEWSRNSQTVYKRNPDYFADGRPYVDELVIKVIGSDDQRMNALRTGDLDVDWSLIVQDAKTLEGEGYNVHRLPLIGGTGLQFNMKDPVVSDDGLRQAMLHAFDSEQIVSAVYPGGESVDAFLPPDNPNRSDDLGVFPEKDLDKAQELFDEYLKRTGKSSETVTFTCYADIPALEKVAQLLKSQMEEIDGLTFEVDAVDPATLVERQNNKDFQTIMGATLSPGMDKLYRVFHSDGTLNAMGYSNPKVDAALDKSRSSNDPAEVEKAYQIVNGEISKDAPLRNWRYQTGHLIAGDEVHGLEDAMAGYNAGAGAYWQYVWLEQ